MKYLIHTFKYASGHKSMQRRVCYIDNAEGRAQALKNWEVLGGSLERVNGVPGQLEFESLRERVLMCEISEMIDGNSYHKLTESEKGSNEWVAEKAKFMSALARIYSGDIDPVCGVWTSEKMQSTKGE